MKVLVFGLSLLLTAVAWLTPAPTEQESASWKTIPAITRSTPELVLIDTEADLRRTALPAADEVMPAATHESLPIR
ncbi:MAG: hypothetical protein AAF333_02140 [Planctomycetota bacterium]